MASPPRFRRAAGRRDIAGTAEKQEAIESIFISKALEAAGGRRGSPSTTSKWPKIGLEEQARGLDALNKRRAAISRRRNQRQQ